MSLFSRRLFGITQSSELIPPRPSVPSGTVAVTNDSAMRHSGVWAALRLRADLISTMPVDCYRVVDGRHTEVQKPPVLVAPGGERVDVTEWLYSSQVDLDRGGNCFGLITERNALRKPARIDLVPLSQVSIKGSGGAILKYRFGSTWHDPADVWHEKQYTVAGSPLGLSPVAYAAWSVGEYLSAQQFALDWFSGGGVPKAHLRNAQRVVPPEAAATIKERFKASVTAGDLFVSGHDWEYNPIQASAAESNWLEAKQAGIPDIARFFGVPSDAIDAAVSGSSVTYANIVQRNLQLLIHNLGPAVTRRERALSSLLPAPRFVKLNTDALLRMDPASRSEMLIKQVAGRLLAPSEARALEDRLPFTEAQVAEFDRLFGSPNKAPQQGAKV